MIDIKCITKAYSRGNPIIEDISILVKQNEICCLLGKNGSGKSTTLNIVAQLVKQNSGQVIINSKEISDSEALIDLGVGMLSQFDNLIDQISGYQYLEFQGLLFKIQPSERENRIRTLTEYFFDDMADIYKQISGYSSGMRMKLRIIALLMHRPSILILDEPFSHLDPFSAEKLVVLLNEYKTMNDNLALISSHDLLYVEKVASRICVLHDRTLVFNGSIDEFTKDNQIQMGQKLFELVGEKQMSTENISWLW